MPIDTCDKQLLENAAAAIGLEGYWETVPNVKPLRQAFYIARESAGTMVWAEEWNPVRDDYTQYSLIRGLGLLTRNRELLDKHIEALRATGLVETEAVDKAIVYAAAEIGAARRSRK